MVPITIRPVQQEDLPALAALHVHAWQWAYRGLLPDEYLDRLPDTIGRRIEWRREQLRTGMGEHRTWLAEMDGRLVGFADTGPSQDEDASAGTATLYAIYLARDMARRGIGRALLRHALDDLRARGFARATLWVLDTNQRARSFYEAVGWAPDGGTKADPRPGFVLNELRYAVDLTREE